MDHEPDNIAAPLPRRTSTDGSSTTSSSNLRRRHNAKKKEKKPAPKFKNIATMVMKLQRTNMLQSFGVDPAVNPSQSQQQQVQTPPLRGGKSSSHHQRYKSFASTDVPTFQSDGGQQQHHHGYNAAANNLPMFSEDSGPASHFLDHAQHLENLFSNTIGPLDQLDNTNNQYHDHPNQQQQQQEQQQHHRHVSSVGGSTSSYGVTTPVAKNDASYYGTPVSKYAPMNEETIGLIGQSHHHEQSLSFGGRDVEEGSYQNQQQAAAAAATATATATALAGNNNNNYTKPARPNFFKRCWSAVWTILLPTEIVNGLQHFVATTVFLFIVPCVLAAALFYYPLENPDLQFLPSGAHLSWFFLLAARLAVTFSLAQATQWILRVLTIRTNLFVNLFGPLPALVVMQSVGWPCLLVGWGCWNIVLLHGTSSFVRHWLWFTDIRLFSMEFNFGAGILGSDLYGRILAAMIAMGIASAAKRTFVALYLSRRMLQYYRTDLETVMNKVKLVVDVADLAGRTEEEGFEELVANAHEGQLAVEKNKKSFMQAVPTFANTKNTKKDAAIEDSDDESDDDDGDEKETDGKAIDNTSEGAAGGSDNSDDSDSISSDAGPEDPLEQVMNEIEIPVTKMKWNDLKQRAVNDRYAVKYNGDESTVGGSKTKRTHVVSAIFPFLDRWQEPDDKGRKGFSPSLHDILQFKKAVTFMETDFPFGPDYGSAANRKACVKNAVKVYRRLLKYTPDQEILPFDVIGALAYEENGDVDEDLAIELLRVFLPDRDESLSMLAFVQSCDNVYKQLRFLRASISNSSKIDSVLENIFNLAFYAVLGLMALTLCGFNPWPLLVSISTLTVSFAFAFGGSVAKYVEGVLLIAVRRPYDIGDRVTIAGAEMVANPSFADTWLVEDISLTTTTLRYASTNELATINNASVANSRIVNHHRSPKASVTIRIRFHIDVTQKQVDAFRKKIEEYFEERPRIWVGLIHYRAEVVDNDKGFVEFVFRGQHVKSWQDLGTILIDKGEWERYAITVATEMGIIMEFIIPSMTVGLGLAPEKDSDRATDDRKRVAEFIRSIITHDAATIEKKTDQPRQPYGVVSEYS